MDHYQLVISRCKRIERLLEQRFGADGRGLHEKASSVSGKLPAPLLRKLRYIATVRNKLIHEAGGDRIDDPRGYRQACDQAEVEIDRLTRPARKPRSARVLLLALIAAVLAIAAWIAWRGWG